MRPEFPTIVWLPEGKAVCEAVEDFARMKGRAWGRGGFRVPESCVAATMQGRV